MVTMRERLMEARVRTPTRYFIPEGETERILGQQQVYQHLAKDANVHEFEIPKFVDLVIRSARKVLAILLMIGKEHHLVKDFLYRELFDDKLPLCGSQLQHTTVREQFLLEQYTFSAPVLKRGAIHRRLDEATVLPFLLNEPVTKGEGAFGTVFKIEIHPSHQYLMDPLRNQGNQSKKIHFARKEFKIEQTSEELFEQEKRVLELLFELKHDNIVKLLVTYSHGNVFNMIFPLSETTLYAYLRTSLPPSSSQERRALFGQVMNLASALDSIHNFHVKIGELEFKLIGCHHDLKPQNILVQGETYQIADFGLSRFKELDGSSKTEWKMGTRSYGPPESDEGRQNGRAYDMWSMGCIMSEIATFSVMGPQGVRDFAQRRETLIAPNRYSDAFHDGNQVKSEVLQWLHMIGQQHQLDSLFMKILDLAKSLLTDISRRPDSQTFLLQFEEILRSTEPDSLEVSLPLGKGVTLHDVALLGDLDQFKALLRGTPSQVVDRLRVLDDLERLPIHLAAQSGKYEIVKQILRLDPEEAARSADLNGHTALHVAAYNTGDGHAVVSTILEWALSKSCFDELLQRKEYSGKTALHLAVQKSNSAVVKVILDFAKTGPFGALELIRDKDDCGNTVLDIGRNKKDGTVLSLIEQCLGALTEE